MSSWIELDDGTFISQRQGFVLKIIPYGALWLTALQMNGSMNTRYGKKTFSDPRPAFEHLDSKKRLA